MPYLPWDASLSVNVPELDEQHRAFIGVLNDLHDVLMEGQLQEVFAARGRALAGIERYIDTHFRAEEEYLAGIGYPLLDEHRRLHERFAAEVKGYRAALAAGDQLLNSELVKTMIRWVRDHLAGEDRKYARYAAG